MNERRQLHRVELNNRELEDALKKAKNILANKFTRIDEQNFRGLYGDKRVDEIIEETSRTESSFHNEGMEKEITRGTIFEALILDLFQNFWFDNFNMKRSSKTDDFKNKVDAILTKKSATSMSAVALSLDPTTSVVSLQKKAKYIKEKRGLTNIDFCEIGNFRGHLEGVPHVALYINDEIFTQIVRLWLNADSKSALRDALKFHPIQLVFLSQILHQLNITIHNLSSKNILTQSEKNSLTFSKEYQRSIQIISSLKKQEIEKYLKSRGEDLKDVLNSTTYLQSIEIIKALFV